MEISGWQLVRKGKNKDNEEMYNIKTSPGDICVQPPFHHPLKSPNKQTDGIRES